MTTNRRSLYVLISSILASSAIAQYDPVRLPAESLNYRMMASGKQIGIANVAIRHEAENQLPLIRIVQVISGAFNQTTEVLIHADSSLRPVSSYTAITQKAADGSDQVHAIRLNYQSGRVSGRMELPATLGGDRRIDELIPETALDFNLVEFALRACPLTLGATFTFPVYNPQQGGRLICRARVTRLEEITVPAGKFVCRRVEVETGHSLQSYFYDDHAPHRLILQKVPALQIDIELLPRDERSRE